MEFLNSLGWPVSVASHAGWTGHVSTSWKSTTTQVNVPTVGQSDHGGALYNGNTHLLYWADVSSEIAFLVPTRNTNTSVDNAEDGGNYSDSSSSNPCQFRIFF